jgi:hypothetical protein
MASMSNKDFQERLKLAAKMGISTYVLNGKTVQNPYYVGPVDKGKPGAGTEAANQKGISSYNNDGSANIGPTPQQVAEQNAAKQAEDAARQLQQRLDGLYSTASGNVTSAYSPYTDQFFTGLQSQYETPYIAELDKQKKTADNEAFFTLARQGLMNSSAEGNLRDRIAGIYSEEKARIQNDAKKFADTQKDSITTQRSLSSQLVNNSKNNEALLSSLIKSPISVTAPQTPKSEVTLGDVFTSKMSKNSSLPQAVGGFGVSSAQGAATSSPYASSASPIFRSPVRGQGKSFYSR